jgi:hypothetical protein
VSFSLTGPAAGTVGDTYTFTVTPAVAATDTLTISASGGAMVSPSSLGFSDSSAPQQFTYTPAANGAGTITITGAHGGVVGQSPLSFSTSSVELFVLGPPTVALGSPVTYYFFPTGTLTDTFTWSASPPGGTFSTTSIVFDASSVAQTATYTPAAAGTVTMTLTSASGTIINTGTLTPVSPLSLNVTARTSALKWFSGLSPRVTPAVRY